MSHLLTSFRARTAAEDRRWDDLVRRQARQSASVKLLLWLALDDIAGSTATSPQQLRDMASEALAKATKALLGDA